MITVYDVTQGTREWEELRRDLYTGSNAHKVLKYGTINYARTSIGTFRGNFYTERGHVLEDEAIELYEAITESRVERPGFVTNSLYATSGFSPDGIHGNFEERSFSIDSCLLEVKCFKEDKHMAIYHARQPIGEIPTEILAQIHFGLFVTEIRRAKLLIYNPDLDPKFALKIIDIPYSHNINLNFKRILRKEQYA